MKPVLATLQGLWNKEDGAITVDWVVLTAIVAVFGGMMVGAMWDEVTTLGDQIGAFVGAREV